MGITKRFHAPETSSSTHNRSTRNSRRQVQRPFSASGNNSDDLPLDLLFRQIGIRLKRHWIALRYRFHSITFGLFRRQYALRILSLAVVGYALFSSESNTWIPDQQDAQLAESRSILTEQALDFGAGQKTPVRLTEPSDPSDDNNQLPPELATPKKESKPASINLAGADEKTRRYIERFHQVAIAEMRKFGVPASISLAQGLIESRSGSSTLAVRNNNHFGIKCFSKNCRKGHCSNHTDDSHKDFFRVYNNAWESWRAHSVMISSGKYASLKKNGKDYRKWARGLKKAGYATDRSYDQKLIGIIERYRLDRFDTN